MGAVWHIHLEKAIMAQQSKEESRGMKDTEVTDHVPLMGYARHSPLLSEKNQRSVFNGKRHDLIKNQKSHSGCCG